MLMAVYKTMMFIWPFLKELFLGKDIDQSENKIETSFKTKLKKIIIFLSTVSFSLNLFFIQKIHSVTDTLIEARQEIADLKAIINSKDKTKPIKLPDIEIKEDEPIIEPAPKVNKSSSDKVTKRPPSDDSEPIHYKLKKIDEIYLP